MNLKTIVAFVFVLSTALFSKRGSAVNNNPPNNNNNNNANSGGGEGGEEDEIKVNGTSLRLNTSINAQTCTTTGPTGNSAQKATSSAGGAMTTKGISESPLAAAIVTQKSTPLSTDEASTPQTSNSSPQEETLDPSEMSTLLDDSLAPTTTTSVPATTSQATVDQTASKSSDNYFRMVDSTLAIEGNVTLPSGIVIYGDDGSSFPSFLNNKTSSQFAELAEMVKPVIRQLYESPDCQVDDVVITGFHQGSIISDYTVALRTLTNMSEKQIQEAVQRKMAELAQKGSSLLNGGRLKTSGSTANVKVNKMGTSTASTRFASGTVWLNVVSATLAALLGLIYYY